MSEPLQELAKILKKLDALAPGASQVVMEISLLRAIIAERTKIETANADLAALARKFNDERHAAVLDSSQWQEQAELAHALLREILDLPKGMAYLPYALTERIQKALPPPPEPTP